MPRSIRSTSSPTALLIVLALAVPLACQTTDNRGAKRGAISGAVVGLTMGALTGDASLAAAGAVAGGVAGGAAGSMSDLQNDRENERTKMTADAIAGRPSGASIDDSRPQTWARLDDFIGKWSCSAWGLDADGKRITATGKLTGTLVSTKSVKLTVDSFDAIGFSDDVDAEFSGYSELSYDPDAGYGMRNVYTAAEGDQHWVGERLSGDERYSFYYVGDSKTAVDGMPRSDRRVELRFVGKDVIILDTYIPGDQGGEKQIQSYRFTRVR